MPKRLKGSWADHVNYTVKNTSRAKHLTMRILKKGNSNTKSLAYMSLVRPILKYGAARWDPYREGQISALDRVQKRAAKFAHHSNSPKWETVASRRKPLHWCALYKSLLWRTGVEGYREQIGRTTLSEQGRSWGEN